jgi:hypothetical protein
MNKHTLKGVAFLTISVNNSKIGFLGLDSIRYGHYSTGRMIQGGFRPFIRE